MFFASGILVNSHFLRVSRQSRLLVYGKGDPVVHEAMGCSQKIFELVWLSMTGS